MFVTEDTTRADPETIRALYTTAIRCGARAVCVCDTVGHATPDGAREVVKFVRRIIDEQGEKVRLDWHGHQDRGLGVINSIAAIQGGADQVHGSALGMGERVGNTPMDQLLVNLKLMGWIDNDLTRLREYCDKAAEACRWTIPLNYPVFGRDAFRTATGVHAAAVIKSYRKGDTELADLIYSGVPAGQFGLKQVIEVGPMSGKSNVIYWLESRGVEASDDRVNRIYDRAKTSDCGVERGRIVSAGLNGTHASGVLVECAERQRRRTSRVLLDTETLVNRNCDRRRARFARGESFLPGDAQRGRVSARSLGDAAILVISYLHSDLLRSGRR